MTLKITINNEIQTYERPVIVKDLFSNKDIYGAIIANKVYDLNHLIDTDCTITPILKDSDDGRLIYARTINFMIICAIKKLLNKNVKIMHSIAKGQFIKIEDTIVDNKLLNSIINTINTMINDNLVIKRYQLPKDDVIKIFNSQHRYTVAKLISKKESETCSIYELDGNIDYFYGILLPNTNYISQYKLEIYEDGLWLNIDNDTLVKQDKLFQIFKRSEEIAEELHLATIVDLNDWIENNKYQELIKACEYRLNKDINKLVDKITYDTNINTILLSGPSNSGKTTLSRLIAENLESKGKKALYLSLDDFFLEREDTPLLPDGSYDFENITCIDLALFNDTLNKLINREPVYLPTFDFVKGKKFFAKDPTILQNNQYLIIEGLHALNPLTTAQVDAKYKYLIYINALTHLNLDDHNYISTSDYRLIRRMIRDYQFRNQSIKETIAQWPKVKDGENKYIYPYQEKADTIINTSLIYEMPIFKKILLPLINEMDPDCKEYLLAAKIKRILNLFIAQDSSLVPPNSLLREFIGPHKQ